MKKRAIPNRQAAKLSKADQMFGVVSATGVDPTHFGMTKDDVDLLGTLRTKAHSDYDDKEDAKEMKKGKTNAYSGTGQSEDQLMAHVQYCANKIRMSDATDDEVLSTGVDRRKPTATPKLAPADEPGLVLVSVQPGVINYRLVAQGSTGRARPDTAIGAQIAVVDATNPSVNGEADKAPATFTSRTLNKMDSSKFPSTVRLYARWQTATGLFSPWSVPLIVKVV